MMEQVKGVRYSLNEFLGPAYWRNGPEVQPVAQSSEDYEKSLLKNSEKNDLYHCVIYLAPGMHGTILTLVTVITLTSV